MLSDHAAPFGLEGIQEYKPIANPRPGIFARTYHFVSYAQKYQYPEFFGYPTDNDDWDVFVRMHHLEVPDNPKYKDNERFPPYLKMLEKTNLHVLLLLNCGWMRK